MFTFPACRWEMMALLAMRLSDKDVFPVWGFTVIEIRMPDSFSRGTCSQHKYGFAWTYTGQVLHLSLRIPWSTWAKTHMLRMLRGLHCNRAICSGPVTGMVPVYPWSTPPFPAKSINVTLVPHVQQCPGYCLDPSQPGMRRKDWAIT